MNIILLMAVFFLLNAWLWPYALYRQGLNPEGVPIGTLKQFIGVLLINSILLLVLIVRFIVQFRSLSKFRLILKLVLIASAMLVITLPVLFVTSSYHGLPSYVPFMYGFLERMQENADTKKIQNWLEKEGSQYMDQCLVESEYPDAIRVLKPKSVWVQEYKHTHQLFVRLEWGGVLIGHWGLVVGPTDLACPPCDLGMDGEYRLPSAKGAYVWFDW
ncbi:MAG TPA: hypothetical protein PKB02_16450 [Anaerohalosphaeraceae bacterium]|nr:hypothetical protein [Anaerohalosphaeraceae bacterium]